jgi:hypothetical protein
MYAICELALHVEAPMARSSLSVERSLDLLPLPEALRTVGLRLEIASAPRAKLTVDPVGIVVVTEAAYGQRGYRWSELECQLDAEALRSHARWLRSCNVDPRQGEMLPEPRPWWAIWRK